MASISPTPKLQFFAANGTPLVGGKLYSYAAGTTTPLATYTDESGGTANPNPVILDSRGEASVWFGSAAYKLRLTTATDVDVWTVDNLNKGDAGTLAVLAASGGSALIGFVQAGTGAVAQTLQSRGRNDFFSSDYTTLQQGITAAAGGTFRVLEGVHTITAALLPLDDTTIILEAGAIITTATADINHIYINGKSNVKVIGPGKLRRTSAGTSAYCAGVHIKSSTNCVVDNVQFVGMQWAGVWLDNATNCTISRNLFTAALGTVQDASDVMVWEASYNNTVEGNWCISGCHTGIMVQDPYSGILPKRNKIRGNWSVGHSAYGIAVYLPATGDTYNEITGNYIQNILGSYATNRSSGSGIYVVGAGAGGTSIVGNTIIQCCQQTLDRSLAPAGIGINGVPAGAVKPIIEGNTVGEMDQGDGILITSCAGGVSVGPNTVNIPSTNNGTGVGGASLAGSGLRIEASNKVNVTGGGYDVLGTGYGCLVLANGSTMSDIIITGGYYSAVSAYGIAVTKTAAEVINNIQINTARVSVTGTTLGGVFINGVTDGTIVGITVRSNTQPAIIQNASTGICYSGCSFNSTTGAIVSTSGTCTNSSMDLSNNWTANTAKMDNSGTGLRVEWYGATASPASGTWAVGDRAVRVPVVGQPKAWSCTVAGTPGTWVSEGNL